MPETSTKLATSTHTLTLFPGKEGDRPYYTLASKGRPELATPLPVTLDNEISIKQMGKESETALVKLGNEDIGEINTKDEAESKHMAKFVSSWRDVLLHLESDGTRPDDAGSAITIGTSGSDNASASSINYSVSSSSKSKKPAADGAKQDSQHRRIKEVLRERVDEYIEDSSISLRVITWNTHGDPLHELQLGGLLGLPIVSDIYVLALQESDTLGPRNLYANTTTLENTKRAVLNALGDSFSVVGSNQLLGLMLLVFASDRIKDQISNVRRDTTGTGLFGVWGNKGAASIWLTIGGDEGVAPGAHLGLVNCHLSAGDGKQFVERRRWEFGEIAKKLKFEGLVIPQGKNDPFDFDAKELEIEIDDMADDLDFANLGDDNDDDDLKSNYTFSRKRKQMNFLMGDLNYRVTMDADMVRDFSDRGDYETILVQDQLNHSIKDDRILQGYTEGKINFPPTYKYVLGTDNFDNSERTPSYTDRIFYSRNDDRITQRDYRSCMDYKISDHKPVTASFEINVPFTNFDKRKEIFDQSLKSWDLAENANRPVVCIEPHEIAAQCKVFQPTESYVKLTHNASSTSGVIQWSIKMVSNDGNTDANVHAEPDHGSLPCGANQYIRFRCTTTVETPDISQIGIVSIVGGQDIFVPLEFKSDPTCLGRSLDLMSRMPDGARKGKIMDQSSTNMPREIWSCIDYLWSRMAPDMFDKPGDSSLQNQIQEWIDDGEQLDATVLEAADQFAPKISVYSVAQQFLTILKYIEGGIVSVDQFNAAVKHGKEAINLLFEILPGVNVNVLIYIAGFLRKAIKDGGCEEKRILEVFDPLLLSEPRNHDFLNRDKKKRREFLRLLILGEDAE